MRDLLTFMFAGDDFVQDRQAVANNLQLLPILAGDSGFCDRSRVDAIVYGERDNGILALWFLHL